MTKPDPRIYARVCARLKVPAGETAFPRRHRPVRDRSPGGGLHALLFSGTAQAIRDIEALLAAGPLAGDQRPPGPGTYPPGHEAARRWHGAAARRGPGGDRR